MWSMEETDIQIKLETAELDMGPLAQEGISNRKKADRIIWKPRASGASTQCGVARVKGAHG